MKKILTLALLIVMLMPLSPSRAQFFPDCDQSGNYPNNTSGWHPAPYSWLRYAECLSAFVYEPGDPVVGEVTVIMYGGIAYTLTFPVQEKIYFYILHGSDTLATNIPDVVVPDTNVVTWSFGEGESLGLFIDSTANWPPGEYELLFSLTALPEFELVLPFTLDAPVPVELENFTAKLVRQSGQQDILLEWNTAIEINNIGWHIERCDQAGWQRISWQDGAGNSNSPKFYSYLDRTAQGLAVQYRLLQIGNDGTMEFSPIVGVERTLKSFSLSQNYPNPFNPSTNILYTLPLAGNVDLRIYNMLGQEIGILVNEEQPPGFYMVTFNAGNLPSGMYVYQLKIGEYAERKKMTFLK